MFLSVWYFPQTLKLGSFQHISSKLVFLLCRIRSVHVRLLAGVSNMPCLSRTSINAYVHVWTALLCGSQGHSHLRIRSEWTHVLSLPKYKTCANHVFLFPALWILLCVVVKLGTICLWQQDFANSFKRCSALIPILKEKDGSVSMLRWKKSLQIYLSCPCD